MKTLKINVEKEYAAGNKTTTGTLVNTYRYILAEDYAEHFENSGFDVVVKRVSDGSNCSPYKAIILGKHLSIAFHSKSTRNQYGYTNDSIVICEVVFKNGEVAQEENTLFFFIEDMNDAEVTDKINNYLLVNKSKLEEESTKLDTKAEIETTGFDFEVEEEEF
ncbi:hypothetical protein ACX1NX_02780 [Acinetobacter sp. ANC 5383]